MEQLDKFISNLQSGEKINILDTEGKRLLVTEKSNQVYIIRKGEDPPIEGILSQVAAT